MFQFIKRDLTVKTIPIPLDLMTIWLEQFFNIPFTQYLTVFLWGIFLGFYILWTKLIWGCRPIGRVTSFKN